MRPVRIKEEDLEEHNAWLVSQYCPPLPEVGLYQSCHDCVSEHRRRFSLRNSLDPKQVTNDMMC